MAKETNPLEILTPKFRVSFPELFQAKAFDDQEAKFSVQMLFDKKTDLSALKNVAKIAITEKWGNNPPKGIMSPFKDGNEKDLTGYENTIVVGSSSKFKPQVIDVNKEEILAPDDVYAGCYARAVVRANAWEYKNKQGAVMKRGVSFYLVALQKLSEGERFVKTRDASDLFDDVSDGSNDSSNYEADDFDL